MRRSRSQKCVVDGISFDSISEACFFCWCREAKELGIISSFEVQPAFHLTDKVTYMEEVPLKTKVKSVERVLLRESNYTADFSVTGQELKGLIYQRREFDPLFGMSELTGIIDVKGEVQPPGSAAKFSLTQKILYALRGIYVNKVVVAYDQRKYGKKTQSQGFFFSNGVPERLPDECSQKCGTKLYAVWERKFAGLRSIKEVWLK